MMLFTTPTRPFPKGYLIFTIIALSLFIPDLLQGQQAAFSINGTPIIRNQTINICQGTRLQFTNTVLSGITSVQWRFDNGNPNTSATFSSVQVTYNTVGSGLAVQTITRFDGTRDSAR
ncbi:MAG TPA: hypothetical protein PKD90_12535, partial [Phnomibacter sp.]|nr:hypothetical protein [Phnomibacter sp.]